MITKKAKIVDACGKLMCVCVFGCERGTGWCFCVLFSVF